MSEAHKTPCDDIYCEQFLCVQNRDAAKPMSKSQYRRIESQGGNALEMALSEIKALKAENEALKEQAAKDVVRMAGSSELIAALTASLASMTKERDKLQDDMNLLFKSGPMTEMRERVSAAERLADIRLTELNKQAASLAELRKRIAELTDNCAEVLSDRGYSFWREGHKHEMMAEPYRNMAATLYNIVCRDRLASPPSPAPVESKPKEELNG